MAEGDLLRARDTGPPSSWQTHKLQAAMAMAMRRLQATSSVVGHATAVAEVSTAQPYSLRCVWKGAGFMSGRFSARRELKVNKHAGPRCSFAASGDGGGEGRFLGIQLVLASHSFVSVDMWV